VTGAPVLGSAVVSLDCRVIEWKAVASHNVYFCGVVAVREGRDVPALVYHGRTYKQL
jgi:flavin reductase